MSFHRFSQQPSDVVAILSEAGQQQQLDSSSTDSQQQLGDVADVLSKAGQRQQLGCSSADSQQHLESFPANLEVFPFASPKHDVDVTHVDGVVPELAYADDNVGRDVEVEPAASNVSHEVLIAPAGTHVSEQHLSDVPNILHSDGDFSVVGHHESVLPLV
ncbi:hypothetical protein V6N13_113737 [Hibiscus sabdariffa]